MKLTLIRHGEPEWARDGRTIDNPDLTERGRLQAEAMAVALADEQFDEILVSPLRRARQTAEPLLAGCELDAQILPWLAEISSPTWDGVPEKVAIDAFDAHRRQAPERQWDGLPGGEAVDGFAQRVTEGLLAALAHRGVRRVEDEDLPLWALDEQTQMSTTEATNSGRHVAIVAHAGTNTMIMGALLGFPAVPWSWDRLVIGHASISRLTPLALGGSHIYQLMALGDLEHVEPKQRSR